MEYALGDICFDIKGPDSTVKSSVGIMFELAQKNVSDPEFTFTVHDIEINNLSKLESVLPQWTLEKIFFQAPSNDVVLYYKDPSEGDTEVISVAVDDFSIFCCYCDPIGKNLVYVYYRKQDGEVPLSVSSVIVPTLSELFFQRANMLFHAASVYLPKLDTGIMVVADSGGGKTTTTLSLLRNGAKMICDDLTFVAPGKNNIQELTGLPEKMNLTEQTICFFPELEVVKKYTPANCHSKKYPVLISDVYGENCMCQSCRLDLIYFVSRGGKTPSVTPMDPAQAFGKLLKASTFALEQTPTREKAAKLFSILGSAKIFKLNSGPDPDQLGPWIISNCRNHSVT